MMYLISKWESRLTQRSYAVTKDQFTSLHYLEVPPCGAKLHQRKSLVFSVYHQTVNTLLIKS